MHAVLANAEICRVDLVTDSDGDDSSRWFEVAFEPPQGTSVQTIVLTVNWDKDWVDFNKFLYDNGFDAIVPDKIPVREYSQKGHVRTYVQG